MLRRNLRLIAALPLLFFGASWARATSVLPLTLSQMTDQAGRIFVGKCVSQTAELDENGIPATFARFQVEDGVKGVSSGGTLLIKQFGVSRPPLHVGEGQSAVVPMKTMTLAGGSYEEGRDYLLFLYPESDLGFTSPVGAGQGRFEIHVGAGSPRPGAASQRGTTPSTAPLQAATAVNPLNNRFLETFREGPVALEDLVKEVRRRADAR